MGGENGRDGLSTGQQEALLPQVRMRQPRVMDIDSYAPVTLLTTERLARLDPESRAAIALATTGILGGSYTEEQNDPLPVDAALRAVRVLAAAGVPPIAVDPDGMPLVVR
jgi:hypothetical protein